MVVLPLVASLQGCAAKPAAKVDGEPIPLNKLWRARQQPGLLAAAIEKDEVEQGRAGWEPTPWHATQRAAWEALRQASRDG
jgi:hypothetical protein